MSNSVEGRGIQRLSIAREEQRLWTQNTCEYTMSTAFEIGAAGFDVRAAGVNGNMQLNKQYVCGAKAESPHRCEACFLCS